MFGILSLFPIELIEIIISNNLVDFEKLRLVNKALKHLTEQLGIKYGIPIIVDKAAMITYIKSFPSNITTFYINTQFAYGKLHHKHNGNKTYTRTLPGFSFHDRTIPKNEYKNCYKYYPENQNYKKYATILPHQSIVTYLLKKHPLFNTDEDFILKSLAATSNYYIDYIKDDSVIPFTQKSFIIKQYKKDFFGK
jgi:hypothetical protein